MSECRRSKRLKPSATLLCDLDPTILQLILVNYLQWSDICKFEIATTNHQLRQLVRDTSNDTIGTPSNLRLFDKLNYCDRMVVISSEQFGEWILKRNFSAASLTIDHQFSYALLTNLLHLISSALPHGNIRSINELIFNCPLELESATIICQNCQQLQRITISHASVEAVQMILGSCSRLIKFVFISVLSDEELQALFVVSNTSNCRQFLEELTLILNNNINELWPATLRENMCASIVNCFPKLRVLDVTCQLDLGCYRALSQCIALESLSFNYTSSCTYVTEVPAFFEKIGPSLQRLELPNVQSDDLTAIARHCPALRHLRLLSVQHVSADHIRLLSSKLGDQLQLFSIAHCQYMGPSTYDALVLPHLRSLCLGKTLQLSSAVLSSLLARSPALTSLRLVECSALHRDALSPLVFSSALAVVNVQDNNYFCDSDVRLLFHDLNVLKDFRVAGCPQLTRQTLRIITKANIAGLRIVGIYKCSSITDRMLQSFINHPSVKCLKFLVDKAV